MDFKYDHSIYWPALDKLTAERRQERKARWEKAGKLIGESEIYLWGGEEGSVSAGVKPETAVNDAQPSNGLEQTAGAPVVASA